MRIRALLFIFILFLTALSVQAQDVIHKYSGETIEAVVIDISPGVIKYKKYAQQNGPVFSIAREQVEKVVYENGKTITFEKSEPRKEPLEKDPDLNPAKPSPTFGWHIGFGISNLYGDIEGGRMQLASAIGATFTLPVGRRNTIMFGADILSLGCRLEDIDITFDDGSRLVITDANEDLGYISLLVLDKYFFNENHNYFLEGGVYGSFLMNATAAGNAEITDTLGVVTSGAFEDRLDEFYKPYDIGLALGIGGRLPLDKNKKWHLSIGARFYYGLTNLVDAANLVGFDDYRESNIYGIVFVGVDIPTKSKQ